MINVSTYPIILRFITIFAICSVSRPFESPKPGVSMMMTGSASSSPKAYVTNPLTLDVSDSSSDEVLKYSASPHSEFAVDDLPWPVTPIKHIDLNLAERDLGSWQQDWNYFRSGSLISKTLVS